MNVQRRNNVNVIGEGSTTLLLSHGFGCDQNVWRRMTADLAMHYRLVLFDLVGSGNADPAAYDLHVPLLLACPTTCSNSEGAVRGC